MRRIMGNLGISLIVTASFTIIPIAMTSCGLSNDSENGARLAADGVSFDPVPTDVNIDCNYHILQGTQRFRGTYFVIPKVKIAHDRENKTAIKMLPLASGNVAFDFAMNFLRGTESRDTKPGLPGAERYANTCDFEKLRESINKHYEDLKQPEHKVWSLSPLPITNVEVRIDGIGNPVLLSPEGTNITTWLGDTISSSIELTKPDSERLMSKVSRGLGIQLVTSFKFEARETREFGSMTFNGADVAKALDAQLNYDGPVAAGVILEAELKTKLAEAIRTSSAQAVFESDSDKLSSAAESLMKLMIEKVSPDKLMAPKRERFTDDRDDRKKRDDDVRDNDFRDDWDSEDSSYDRTNDRNNRDRFRDPWIRNLPSRNFVAAGDTTEDADAPASEASKKPAPQNRAQKSILAPMEFKVSAVMEFLRSQTNTKVEYRIMGKLVSETAAARSKMITGHVGANDESTVEVTSGARASVIGTELDSEKTLKLMISGRKLYTPQAQRLESQYLSKAALLEIQQRDGVSLDFPQLVDWSRAIHEFTPNEMTGPRAYVYDSYWNPFNWAFYVWGKSETKVIDVLEKSEDSENVSTSSIRLSFSRITKGYSMKELSGMAASQKETDPFTVKVENDGSFTITAKTRLGAATLENTEKFATREFIVTEYFQEMWSAWKNDRLQSEVTWSKRNHKKSYPAGRSVVTVRLLQGDGVPDVTFEEN